VKRILSKSPLFFVSLLPPPADSPRPSEAVRVHYTPIRGKNHARGETSAGEKHARVKSRALKNHSHGKVTRGGVFCEISQLYRNTGAQLPAFNCRCQGAGPGYNAPIRPRCGMLTTRKRQYRRIYPAGYPLAGASFAASAGGGADSAGGGMGVSPSAGEASPSLGSSGICCTFWPGIRSSPPLPWRSLS